MTNKRTIECKKKRNFYFIFSMMLWLGVASFYAIVAIKEGLSKSEAQEAGLGTYILSMSMTLIIALILTIVIKDKVRSTIWMASVVLSSIIFKESGMYVTFALWALDEYVIFMLYKRYKRKVEINKEIDLRDYDR